MLYSNVCVCGAVGHDVCECGAVGHDVCETIGHDCVSLYADFLDGVINPYPVRGQRKVRPTTKYARVRSALTWYM